MPTVPITNDPLDQMEANEAAVASLRLAAKMLDDLLHVAPALAALRAELEGKSGDESEVRTAAIAPALRELRAHVERGQLAEDRAAGTVIAAAKIEASKIKAAAQQSADELLASARAEVSKTISETEAARVEYGRVSNVLASKQGESAALTREHENLVAVLEDRERRLIARIGAAREGIKAARAEYAKVAGELIAKCEELASLSAQHETLAAAVDRKEARLVEVVATGKSALAA
jgi:chromosome segregation ATPase